MPVKKGKLPEKVDLGTYRMHPEHRAFITFNKDYAERKAIVDFFL